MSSEREEADERGPDLKEPKHEPVDGPILKSSERGAGKGSAENATLSVNVSVDGPRHVSAENPNLAGNSIKISDSPKPREALNREMYRIPSYSGWFSWGKIHTIERRALPEFFDNHSLSKTPKIYKEYRDFIINKYRENSRRALTFTEVRKMLVGDVNLLKKVFNFLEYWGLINYHIIPQDKVQVQGAVETPAAERSPINHKPAALDMKPQDSTAVIAKEGIESSEVAPLVSNSEPSSLRPAELAASSDHPPHSAIEVTKSPGVSEPPRLSSHKNTFTRPISTLPPEAVGDFPSLAKSTDWRGDWTPQELLRMLEAIARFGGDWSRVAAHVGSKSRAECVLRFIKLPFGDQFSSEVGAVPSGPTVEAKADGKEGKGEEQGVSSADLNSSIENPGLDEVIDEPPSKRNRLSPLADSSNPILAQVAFLSAMVGPRVAAAAAQAAVAALTEEDPLSSQILSTSCTQAGASQATSKDGIKVEPAEDEDSTSGKGQRIEAFKDMEAALGPLKDAVQSVTQGRASIGMAAGAVAANAKLLADQEEREIEHLITSIIETQLRKLQSKVDHYEELEFLLEKEHGQLEKARMQVLVDWIRYSQYHYNSGPS